MHEPVQALRGPGDADATVVLPMPGRPGHNRYTPSLDRHATAADLSRLGGLNPLIEAANPILAAVPQIRHALRHPDPAGLRARLREQLENFDAAARAAGVADDRRYVARYALCAVLDDAAAAAPWGRDWARTGLTRELYGDSADGEKFFALLDPLTAQPGQYRDLLELFYVCLALGFEGRYRGEAGRLPLGQIRSRLHKLVARGGPPAPELSVHWRGAERRQGRDWLALMRTAFASLFGRSRLPASAAAARGDGNASPLQRRLAEVEQVLSRARVRGVDGERRAASQLPWYLCIGAPGSGKTTALLHAGLHFPLSETPGETTLHRAGGTRNCDWWLSSEAVLIDTAGRFTTDDMVEADRAAWLGLLDALGERQASQPLNGVIVALSVYDLVHWTDEEIARHAAQVRERIAEVQARLRQRLPVYLLVTKADLLAGFVEFFAELDAEQRAQVWGVTFPVSEVHADPRGSAGRIDEELEHLEQRLYGLLPGRLHDERDLQRRGAIYRFPQQFRGVRPLVCTFVDAAFGGTWEGERPLLRGVYFTSATQEGSAIDRVLAPLSRSFNLERKVQPPNVGTGKAFFLRRLMREVVFGESALAPRRD